MEYWSLEGAGVFPRTFSLAGTGNSLTTSSQNIFGRGTSTIPFLRRNSRAKHSIAQTSAMGVGDVAPGPLEKDDDPISKLDDEKQVDE